MLDGPPKTLSSRFQALSHLQPAEPPRTAPKAAERGCRRPRPPRRQKDRFSSPNPAEQQSRIVLLAPLPGERKPAIGSQACNALIPPAADVLLRHFIRPARLVSGPRDTAMQIALFQPDIPQNTGTILRLCACLDVAAHIIEPAGFPISDRHFRRAGMDYLDQVNLMRHDSWSKFEQWRNGNGLSAGPVYDQGARVPIWIIAMSASDILLFGRESAGVTDEVVARRRRAAGDPDQAGAALAQCRDGGRDGAWRGAAADPFRDLRRFGELRGQGNLSDPAGRRRACRPRGGVLPFRRLQPLERPRAGPRHRDLPVLRHRFCRNRRHAGRPLCDRRRTRRHHRRAMDRRDRQPLCRADRRRAAVAGRCAR